MKQKIKWHMRALTATNEVEVDINGRVTHALL
jgi:hypothetical protein